MSIWEVLETTHRLPLGVKQSQRLVKPWEWEELTREYEVLAPHEATAAQVVALHPCATSVRRKSHNVLVKYVDHDNLKTVLGDKEGT